MKSNKTVIITGSNSGIGFELAKKLISENYFVILACRNRKKGLDAEKRLGIRSKFIEIDLSNYESIDTFSRQIRNEKLSINYLCRDIEKLKFNKKFDLIIMFEIIISFLFIDL